MGKPGVVVPGKAQIYPFCFLMTNSLTLAKGGVVTYMPLLVRWGLYSALGWTSLLLLDADKDSEYSWTFGLLHESCIRCVVTRTSSYLMCWSTFVTVTKCP